MESLGNIHQSVCGGDDKGGGDQNMVGNVSVCESSGSNQYHSTRTCNVFVCVVENICLIKYFHSVNVSVSAWASSKERRCINV